MADLFVFLLAMFVGLVAVWVPVLVSESMWWHVRHHAKGARLGCRHCWERGFRERV